MATTSAWPDMARVAYPVLCAEENADLTLLGHEFIKRVRLVTTAPQEVGCSNKGGC